jgi:hypothetical protein
LAFLLKGVAALYVGVLAARLFPFHADWRTRLSKGVKTNEEYSSNYSASAATDCVCQFSFSAAYMEVACLLFCSFYSHPND